MKSLPKNIFALAISRVVAPFLEKSRAVTLMKSCQENFYFYFFNLAQFKNNMNLEFQKMPFGKICLVL